jgi:Malate/lactate dehydrogenases
MDVAVLGASGDCGREIVSQLVASRLLAPTERMQLVGRAEGRSARMLYGLASDLADAHAEYLPEIDVALSPREIIADLWVVATGATMPTTTGQVVDRDTLAMGNARVFAEYAETLARYGQGTEVVVVVSNPVELGVALFARAIGRHRVIGIGAYQDSLRFRREIAADLGVRRQRVSGFMLGEHGEGQVPVWSGVKVHSISRDEQAAALKQVRQGTEGASFLEMCRAMRGTMNALIQDGRIQEAFAYVDSLPPDVRVVLKPYVTHLSGAKTVLATANVTVSLVETLLRGDEALIAGQVQLTEGEFYGMSGPLGVPVIVSPGGVLRVVELPMSAQEQADLTYVSESVNAKVAGWMRSLEEEGIPV